MTKKFEANSDDFSAGIFDKLFGQLQKSEVEGKLQTRATTFKFENQEIFAGRDSFGFPHLLIPMDPDQNLVEMQFSPRLSLSARQLQGSHGETAYFWDLTCSTTKADRIFAAICFDLSTRLLDPKVGGFQVVLGWVIDEWREIFAAIAEVEPSRSEKIGLIGELLTLADLVEIKNSDAVKSWFGPDKARHDFEFLNSAIEVKTSTSLNQKKCTIHGLNQLDSAPETTLHLLLIRVELASVGICISEILDGLQEKLANYDELREKLLDFWPMNAERPSWFENFTVKLVDASIYAVDEEFPRISSGMLPNLAAQNISGVTYTVALDRVKASASSGKLNRVLENFFND